MYCYDAFRCTTFVVCVVSSLSSKDLWCFVLCFRTLVLCLFTVAPFLFLCFCCVLVVSTMYPFCFAYFSPYISCHITSLVYWCFWAFVTVETCLKTYLICTSYIVRLSWFAGPEIASPFCFFFTSLAQFVYLFMVSALLRPRSYMLPGKTVSYQNPF